MGFISGLFKDKNQKYLENLKKNNKIREEEEQAKTEIFTIGKVDKEIHEKKDIEGALAQGSEEMKVIRASREKELKAIQDQLFVINEAKIKFGSHIGTFKVLSDTPTIQGKTVGTEIEKSPANFTFVDGFQLLSLTQWQDIGTGKYQDNLALIKKSTIMGTGKMPPANAPIESGKIEFIDSGQINEPEDIDTTGMPMPSFDEQQMKYPPIVHFRPLPEWDGEFGFDWLRDEPTIVKVKREKDRKKVVENDIEPPYCETIEAFFSKSRFSEEVAVGNSNKNEAYDELKKEYVKLTLSTGEEYYVPWLTLLPKKKAVLQLVYQGDTDTDMDILLEYEDNYIGITPYKKKNAIKSLKDAAGKKIKTIEITAKETFSSIQEIKVYTSLMGEKVLIGQLLVLPNDKIRTISKVKLIGVKTEKKEVKFPQEQKDALERILSQAFLRVDYKELSCTLKEENIFPNNYMTSSKIVIAGEEFLKNLKEKYVQSEGDDGSILIFFVDREATNAGTSKESVGGFTLFEIKEYPMSTHDKAPSYEHSRTSVVFVENSEYTLAHEFLHCLGLGHIHRDFGGNGYLYKKQRFIFIRGANVTNIMGYSSIKKGIFWSWQWRLLSPYLNEVITNKLEGKNEN